MIRMELLVYKVICHHLSPLITHRTQYITIKVSSIHTIVCQAAQEAGAPHSGLLLLYFITVQYLKVEYKAHYSYKLSKDLKCSTLDELITDFGRLFHCRIAEVKKE